MRTKKKGEDRIRNNTNGSVAVEISKRGDHKMSHFHAGLMYHGAVKKFTKCSDCKFLAYDTFWKIDELLVCGDCAEDRKRSEPPSKKRRKKGKGELVKIPQEQFFEEVGTDDPESKNTRLFLEPESPASVQALEDIRMEEGGSEKPEEFKTSEKLKVKKPDVREERRPLIVRLKLGTRSIATPIALDETPSRKSSQQSRSSSPSRKRSQQSSPSVLPAAETPSPRSSDSTTPNTLDDVPSRKPSQLSQRATPENYPPTLDKYPSGSPCQGKPISESPNPPQGSIIEAVPFTPENLSPHKSTVPSTLGRPPRSLAGNPSSTASSSGSSTNKPSSALPSVFNKDESLEKLYGLCSNPDCKEGLYDESSTRDKLDEILCYECWRHSNKKKKGEVWQRNGASISSPEASTHSDEASLNSGDPDFLKIMCCNESPSPSSSSGGSMPSLSPVSSRIKSLEEATQLLLENLEGRERPELKECLDPQKNIKLRKRSGLLKSPESRKSVESMKSSGTMKNSELKKIPELRTSSEPAKSPEAMKSPDFTKSLEIKKSSDLQKSIELKKSSLLGTSPRLPKSLKHAKSAEPTKNPESTESPEVRTSSDLIKSIELKSSPLPGTSPGLTKTPELQNSPELTKTYELRKRPEPSQENSSPVCPEESEPNPKLKKLLEANDYPKNSTFTHVNKAEEVCASCERPFRSIPPRRLCHPETHEIVCPACYRNFEITRKCKIQQLEKPKFQNTMAELKNEFEKRKQAMIENGKYGFEPLPHLEPEYPPRRTVKEIRNYFDSAHFQNELHRFQKETEKRVKVDNEPRKGECRDLVEDGRPRCNNHFCRVLLGGSGYAHPVTGQVVCPPCYKFFKKRRSNRKEKPAYNETICEEKFRTWSHPTTNEKCCYMCFKNVVWLLRSYIKKSSLGHSSKTPSQQLQKSKKPQKPVMESPIGASRPLFSIARLLPFNNSHYKFTFPDFFNIYPTIQNLSTYPQKNGSLFISSSFEAPVMVKPQGLARPKSPPEVIVLDDDSDSEKTRKMVPVRQEKVKKSRSFRIADLIDLKESGKAKENGKTVEKEEILAGNSMQTPGKPPKANQGKLCFTPNCKTVLTPSRQFYLHGTKNWICCACYRAYLKNELKKVAEVEKMEKEKNPKDDCDEELIDVEAIDNTEMDSSKLQKSPVPSCSDTLSPAFPEKDDEYDDDDDENESIEDFSDEDINLLESMDNDGYYNDTASDGAAVERSGDSGTATEMDMKITESLEDTNGENRRELDKMGPKDPVAKVEEFVKTPIKKCEETDGKNRENLDEMEMVAEETSEGAVLNDKRHERPKSSKATNEATENWEANHEVEGKIPDCEQNCKNSILNTTEEFHQKGRSVDEQSFEEPEDFSDEDLDWLDHEDYDEDHHDPDEMLLEVAPSLEQSTGSSPTEAPIPENFDETHQEPVVENLGYEEAKESMPGTPCSELSDEDLDWMNSNYDDQDPDELVLKAAKNHEKIISDVNHFEALPPSQYSEHNNPANPDQEEVMETEHNKQFDDPGETESQCSDDSISVIEDFSFSDFEDEDPEDFINDYPMDVPESQDARISANEAAFENAMEAEYDEYGDRNPLSPVFANNNLRLNKEGENKDRLVESEDSSSSSESSDDDSSSDENSDY